MRFPPSLTMMTPNPLPSVYNHPQPFNEEVSINLLRESNCINKDDQDQYIVEKCLYTHYSLTLHVLLCPLFIVHHSDITISGEYPRIITYNNKGK